MSTNKHTEFDSHSNFKNLSMLDQCLSCIQIGLSTVLGQPKAIRPPFSDAHSSSLANCSIETQPLTEEEKRHSGGLMRVNAVGEICAQGLYLGQAIVARAPAMKAHMVAAAYDEINHLAWCNDRLAALDAHPSYLNPLWFLWSLTLGMAMGLGGDRFSLGFIIETEKQVMAHIEKHLAQLPERDKASAQVLRQMYLDERAHATEALKAGGTELPVLVKVGMKWMSKVMTTVAYYF